MDRYFFSTGAGYKGKHFNFNVAYQFGYGPTHTVTHSNPSSIPAQSTGQTANGNYYVAAGLVARQARDLGCGPRSSAETDSRRRSCSRSGAVPWRGRIIQRISRRRAPTPSPGRSSPRSGQGTARCRTVWRPLPTMPCGWWPTRPRGPARPRGRRCGTRWRARGTFAAQRG